MGLRFDNKVVRFEGHCTVEEALPLAQFLGETEGATVALDGCESMHAALFQTLMALAPGIVSLPGEGPLARALRRRFGDS